MLLKVNLEPCARTKPVRDAIEDNHGFCNEEKSHDDEFVPSE